ncbi:MAG: S8 family serine peptidase [Bacteroidetes bacterium]|nr:S8 family serine peptidase [Bacteroidota bacterium]
MKALLISLCAVLLFPAYPCYSQTILQADSLRAIAIRETRNYQVKKSGAVAWAGRNGYPVKAETGGSSLEIQYIDAYGRPQYYKTDNSNAAATISTGQVYPGGGAGLNLTGAGISVREWDAGSVLSTHQEFDTRVTVVDGVATNIHSTHVAGTIMASGIAAGAKGMAFNAGLRSFDWNSDIAEMATEAISGALISNHSYGYTRGWCGATWYGNPGISNQEDYLFGFYDYHAMQWDQVAWNAPYLLICKSAGNDRGESGTGHPADGPYDCIDQQGVAKNILTVGAVDDIPGGYLCSTDVKQTHTGFSSWGPADDGRIKPDIVANGEALYSTSSAGSTSYATMSGTSMATPSVAGSLALLQQYYFSLRGKYLRSATLKALVIHTADEAGPAMGPDYMFGWGLMNTKKAALKISDNQTEDIIRELTLNNGSIYTREVTALGCGPLKVTIVWTDQPGVPVAASLDPVTPMLKNDLDIRITSSGITCYPWKLDRNNPGNPATNVTKNDVDNTEVVYIENPVQGASYTITVNHKGTLTGGSQAFAMVLSGILTTVSPVSDFVADNTNPPIGTGIGLNDVSCNAPTTWEWSFSPSTVAYLLGTTSSSRDPHVQFTAPGSYSVTLATTNAYGSDAETKTNYIEVVNCNIMALPYAESFSGGTFPVCWTQVDHQGTGHVWKVGTTTGQSPNPALTGTYAYLDCNSFGNSGAQNADLITPTMNLSGYTGITLQFDHYFKGYSGSSGTLSYSINNGVSWIQIQQFTTTSATNPVTFSQLIEALSGQPQVKFKWNYTSTNGWYWGIDNILVTGNGVPIVLNINSPTPEGTQCFDATETILVAGNDATFTIANGESAEMIAGQNIRFYPGTLVEPGGYLHASIAPGGPYCPMQSKPSAVAENSENIPGPERSFFSVYPNPTTGKFTLELNGYNPSEKTGVEIYNLNGKKIISVSFTDQEKYEFCLGGIPSGLYLVRVISASRKGSCLVAKTE